MTKQEQADAVYKSMHKRCDHCGASGTDLFTKENDNDLYRDRKALVRHLETDVITCKDCGPTFSELYWCNRADGYNHSWQYLYRPTSYNGWPPDTKPEYEIVFTDE